MVGEGLGQVIAVLFPQMHIAPAAFALVGMAAVLAGSVHTPLTAIILLFEMTNDYRIILPVMFAVVVSMFISQRLQRDSVYTLALARKGVRLQRGRDVDLLEGITVAEVMQQDSEVLLASQSIESAMAWLSVTRHHGVPVVDDRGRLVGILTLADIERAQNGDHPRNGELTVGDICTRELLVATPDESIGAALGRMSPRDIGRLPVVSRDDPNHLIGILRRSDLVRAYDIAITRRSEVRHRAQQIRLVAFSGASVIDLVVEPGSACADKLVSEVPWPKEAIIASVRRGGQILVPRGDTRLKAGDVLVIVTNGSVHDELARLNLANVSSGA